jgi:DNA-binding transcriptional ArsR family regulator
VSVSGRPRRQAEPPAGSEVFAALADPTRRLVLERLASGDRAAGDLGDGLPMSQAALSQHLRVLRSAGLVEARQMSRYRVYRLRPEGLTALRDWLSQVDRFWADRPKWAPPPDA